MEKKRPSLDGFVPRNRGAQIGGLHRQGHDDTASLSTKAPVRELHNSPASPLTAGRPKIGVSRGEIDESLKQIDEPERDKKGKVRKSPEQRARRKKIIKRVIIALIVIVIAIGGYVAVKTFINTSKAFKGSLFGFVQKTPLKTDANGRSNVLVFGTSEDDEGGTHPGGNLTDSIMLLSIDQNKKNAFMVSMPRDMWVKLDEACDVGYETKINAVYMCGSEDGKNEAAGAQALQKKVGEVFGVDIQYYAHLNYTVVADSVNAVGGVQVTIESDDPRGIYDPNFDWKCNRKCHMVDYKNGQVVTLDGEHALALARARNAEGGYGLPNGNFDREKNQQKILRALQEKAVSAGTLTNIGKVTSLIDAFGNNLRTNFEVKEIRTLADLGQSIKGDKLQSINLDDEKGPVVTTGNVSGQSVVRPVAGLYDYSAIQKYIAKQLTSDDVVREAAQVDVYNGSGVVGAAKIEADKLEAKGVTIGALANAPTGEYGKATLYQVGTGNAATKARLEQTYGIKVSTAQPPVAPGAQTKFILIIGTTGQTTTQ